MAADDVKRTLLSTRGVLFEDFAIDAREACTGYAALERNESDPDSVMLWECHGMDHLADGNILGLYEPYLPGSQDDIKPLGLDRT